MWGKTRKGKPYLCFTSDVGLTFCIFENWVILQVDIRKIWILRAIVG